jgi:hypothetical protein
VIIMSTQGPWGVDDVDEIGKKQHELDALDTRPDVPGIQTYDPDAARRGDRFLQGLALGLFFGFWAGVLVMIVSTVLAVLR